MKTQFTSTRNNTFRNLIAGLSLAAALFISEAASAQTVQFTDQEALHTQVTDNFKVTVFPVNNSLLMKVLFENPDRQMISVSIKDSKGNTVYKKQIGRTALYNGKFDVSQIGDGNYTMVIESRKQSYSNSFLIETQQERIARAL